MSKNEQNTINKIVLFIIAQPIPSTIKYILIVILIGALATISTIAYKKWKKKKSGNKDSKLGNQSQETSGNKTEDDKPEDDKNSSQDKTSK